MRGHDRKSWADRIGERWADWLGIALIVGLLLMLCLEAIAAYLAATRSVNP